MTEYLEPLTDADKALIVEGADTPVGRFVLVWEVILGRYGLSLDALLFRVVTPWDYSLTYEDALWALQQVMDVEDNPLDKAQWALQWVNKGPSYHKEEK